jgi:phytoene dehydrogenase-like protein
MDAIVIGAGHDGLVAASYLARAGMRLMVLERRHVVGGACVTEETFPGFKVSTAAHVNRLVRQEIVLDLVLRRHGFEVRRAQPVVVHPVAGRPLPEAGTRSGPEPRRDLEVQGAPPDPGW